MVKGHAENIFVLPDICLICATNLLTSLMQLVFLRVSNSRCSNIYIMYRKAKQNEVPKRGRRREQNGILAAWIWAVSSMTSLSAGTWKMKSDAWAACVFIKDWNIVITWKIWTSTVTSMWSWFSGSGCWRRNEVAFIQWPIQSICEELRLMGFSLLFHAYRHYTCLGPASGSRRWCEFIAKAHINVSPDLWLWWLSIVLD